MSLKIFLDGVQRRLWKHRIGVTVAGREWVPNGGDYKSKVFVSGENVFMETVTDTLMIEPFCIKPDWNTATPTGNYSRWGLSEFGLLTTDGWFEKSDKQAGQNRMSNAKPWGVLDPSAFSATTLPVNQGMWVSFFNFNEGDKEAIMFECGWNNPGDPLASDHGVSFRFYAGGRVEVWKDGELRATEHINGIGSRNNANKYCNLIIMPFRKREVLVYSPTAGGGFTFLFDEISEDEATPVVLASSKFWWRALIAPDVELAPLKFPATAWGVSPQIVFGNIPETGRVVESCWDHSQDIFTGNNAVVYGHKSYHGSGGVEGCTSIRFVEMTSDTTTFVPNGIKRTCRLRFDLQCNGLSTPFFYGASSGFEPVYADTANSDGEVDVTRYVVGAPKWTVPDSAHGVKFDLEFFNLDDASADANTDEDDEEFFPPLDTIAPHIATAKNRPVRVELDGLTVLNGLLNNLSESGEPWARRLNCEAQDFFYWAERCQVTSRLPLDGMPLCRPLADGISAIGYFCKYFFAGFDGTMDSRVILSDADFIIPYIPGRKADSFGVVAENGDTTGRVFEKLHKLFFESWIYGQKPYKVGDVDQPIVFFTDPVDFPSTPFKDFYCDDPEAIDGGVEAVDVREALFDIPIVKSLDIEGNEVRASGMDPRIELAIQSVKADPDSQDPATLPEDRADNWLGFPLIVGVLDPRFTTTESCERAVLFGFDIITKANYVVEYPCFLAQDPTTKVPAWRGDINKLNSFTYELPVISSFSCSFDDENDTDTDDDVPIHSRNTTYTAGTMYNQGGTGLAQIIDAARAKAHDRTTKGADSKRVLGSLISRVTEV